MQKYKITFNDNKAHTSILKEVGDLMDKAPTYTMTEEEQAMMNIPFNLLQQERTTSTIEAGDYYTEVDDQNQRLSLFIASLSGSVAFNGMIIEDNIIYDISLYYHPRSKIFFFSSNDSYVANGNETGSTFASALYDITDKKKYANTIYYINEVDLAKSISKLLTKIKDSEYLYEKLVKKCSIEDIVNGINSKLKLKENGVNLNKGNVR